MKILITGASGFIGTNALQHYIQQGFETVNVDNRLPRNYAHKRFWVNIDLLDNKALSKYIADFRPDYLIHFAARTDLNENKNLDGYAANIEGVRNLIDACESCPALKRVIYLSSMMVCKFGHVPTSFDDYCPNTLYGESKARMERIIKSHKSHYEWVIVRPTSIWGPWFGKPYLDFFKMVISGRFVCPGYRSGTATYGFVDNVIYQIDCLLYAEKKKINKKIFYLGELNPYNLSEWALKIASHVNKKVFTLPFSLLKVGAIFGDMLLKMKISFPITSFRLNNMIADNILDTKPIHKIAPEPPFNLEKGIEKTIKWIQQHEKYNSI